MNELTHIGYWRSDLLPHLPNPLDFVDEDWEEERASVSSYLASGTIVRAYMGHARCRICGRANGSLEFSDGRYLWPEGLGHYIDQHAVRLPRSVVEHAVRSLAELEAAGVDDDWWLSATNASPPTTSP